MRLKRAVAIGAVSFAAGYVVGTTVATWAWFDAVERAYNGDDERLKRLRRTFSGDAHVYAPTYPTHKEGDCGC